MKQIKHLTHTSDFNKEDYLKVFEIAEKLEKMKDISNLCRGKVLALAFLKESTETLASFQSAIIKLGGGWMGITTKKGTYLEAGEEEVHDTLERLSRTADVMVIRGDKIDFKKLKERIKIPIINGLAEDEHTVGGLCFGYFLKKKFKDLAKLKAGVYGMTGASRPSKAIYRVLSLFGTEVYEDSVIPELGMTPEIKEEVIKKGLKLKQASLDEFIDKVDYFWVVEGLPQAGTDENLVNEFDKKVKIIGPQDIARLKEGAIFFVDEPRLLTDGRCTVDTEIDKSPKRGHFSGAFLYGIMGTIIYLLGEEI